MMELNQHHVWDLRFESEYLLKLKTRNLLMVLKEKLKKWRPDECLYRKSICRTFVLNLGFTSCFINFSFLIF